MKWFHWLAFAAAASGTACASATAHAPPAGNVVRMEIVDVASGSRLPTIRHDGEAYVAGEPGQRYAIRLTNQTGARVLAVLSVDGVNAVTGQTAGSYQEGYVLDAHASYDVTGWRKSLNEVAAFYFTRLPNSYAARTGRPANVGVIGLAAWRERQPVASINEPAPIARPYGADDLRAQRAAPAADAARLSREMPSSGGATVPASPDVAQAGSPSSILAPSPAPVIGGRAGSAYSRQESESAYDDARDRIGTGHGERRVSPVRRVAFEREDHPAQTQKLFYDSHDNLVARGILPEPRDIGRSPEPFPASARFVPDPLP